MLYSPSHDIGFAHYPKTGGTSLGAWFRSVFPDAAYVEPPNEYNTCHLPVRASLVHLGLASMTATGLCNTAGRFLAKAVRSMGGGRLLSRCPTRIIGVMREPLDTIVSLFEYWRSLPLATEPDSPFMMVARRGTFREFVSAAVVDQMLLKYEIFFDVYGPAWTSTRLIDFYHLDSGITAVCDEFGIAPPSPLPHLNRGSRKNRDLSRYRDEAGPLVAEVHRYFGWYYRTADRVMIRGDRRS